MQRVKNQNFKSWTQIFNFLKQAIIETKSQNGVVLHSDLIFLRKFINTKENIINKIFQGSLINSLYLPTFSYYGFNIKKKKIFSISDEAYLLGSLPNFAIKNKIGFRTKNPIHSYICIGEVSENIYKINYQILYFELQFLINYIKI